MRVVEFGGAKGEGEGDIVGGGGKLIALEEVEGRRTSNEGEEEGR